MDSDSAFNKVKEIIAQVLGLDDTEIDRESSPKDIERWDSVSNINIVMSIEQEFDFRFNLGELDTINNVGDIVDAVISHKQG